MGMRIKGTLLNNFIHMYFPSNTSFKFHLYDNNQHLYKSFTNKAILLLKPKPRIQFWNSTQPHLKILPRLTQKLYNLRRSLLHRFAIKSTIFTNVSLYRVETAGYEVAALTAQGCGSRGSIRKESGKSGDRSARLYGVEPSPRIGLELVCGTRSFRAACRRKR